MIKPRDANSIPDAGLFLYDQDCGFCRRSVDFAKRQVRGRVTFTPWQSFDLAGVGLTPAQADTQAWLLLPGGRTSAGGDAIAGVLRRGRPWARVLGSLMLLPGLRTLNRAAYQLIATHRHRLPGGTTACAFPSQRSV